MMNSNLLLTSIITLGLCATPDRSEAQSIQPRLQPNIVIMLADDLGIGDPSCYNAESKIPTPNMDRLAQEGLRFMDAHAPAAVCTPTRYGLLTGRYSWRSRLKSGVLWSGYAPALIEPDRTTIASMLKQHGYHTGCVGKWHLGFNWASYDGEPVTPKHFDQTNFEPTVERGPNSVGFDHSTIIPASLDMPPYVWLENGRAIELPTVYDPGSKRVWSGGDGFWREGLRSPSFKFNEVLPTITEKSVAYINARAKDGKPFFLYVPLASPHTPWVLNEPFREKSGAGVYGDFVHETDQAIGQILKALDRHGLAENTLVIVTSDNGSHWPIAQIEKYDHRANYIYRGQKADIYEGGHRVPMIVRWPGKIEPGAQTNALVGLNDFYATIAEIIGATIGTHEAEDSFSFLSVLQQGGSGTRKTIVHHSINGTFAVREGNWKLIEGLGSGGFTSPARVEPEEGGPKGQLFNLLDDPGEQVNLYLEHPEIVEQLTTLLNCSRNEDRTHTLHGDNKTACVGNGR